VGEIEGVIDAVDPERLAADGGADEGRDDAIVVVGAAAVDVGEADDGAAQTLVAGGEEHALAGDLGVAVDVDRVEGMSRVGGTDRLEVGRTDRPIEPGLAPVIEADERSARGRQN